MTCKGEILVIKKNTGLIIKISGSVKGVVGLTDIADKYRDNPTRDFYKGQNINCYVVSCDDIPIHLSLRKSRHCNSGVSNPVIDNIESLSEGQILQGYITECKKSHLSVSLGHDVTGNVTVENSSDWNIKDLTAAFSVGKVVTAKILSISEKISLSLKESDTGVQEIVPNKLKTKKQKLSDVTNDIKEKQKKVLGGKNEQANKLNKKGKGDRKRKISETDCTIVSVTDKLKKPKVSMDSDSGIEDPDMSDDKKKKVEGRPCLNLKLGWSWDTEYKSPVVKNRLEDDSEDSDDEDDSEPDKKDGEKDKKDQERKLFELEQQKLAGDLTPEGADDFDRLTLQSPDSSLVWLRYMAYHLEMAEVEKARAVAERALKTISFREEQEKMNVWVAYLNLENMYGTPEELTKVLERAIQQNEPLSVYQHLINIYIKSGKFQEAENTYNIITRKFSYKKEPWIGFGLFHFKNGNFEAGRKILPRCLKSLKKEHHVETIAKFAQMEFKHGEPERGKTMFENILSNYPKRTDLWSVYVDMVIKTDDVDAVRQLLDRVIHLKLSAKKMKFFFKKYLDFEKTHGDDKHIEYVKKKAFEYVESKGFVDE